MNMPIEPTLHPPRSPRCVVLGEALVDLFPQGPVIGGAPFNVARNLAALGQPPLVVTRLGRDALGEQILREFTHWGMPFGGVQHDEQRPTGVVTVTMEGSGHRFEIGRDQAWDALDRQAAVDAVTRAAPEIVCFGTLAQRSAPSREAIRAALHATPALRFLDLNLRDGPDNEAIADESLRLAQIVKVNDDELAQVLEWFVHPHRPAAPWGTPEHAVALVDLMAHFGLHQLVVTRGAQGHAVFDARGDCVAQGPAPATAVADTVGAGDAFAAVCLLGRLLGWPLPATLERAGAFAGAVCTLTGAVTPEPGFYAHWRARWQLEPAAPRTHPTTAARP